MNVNVEVGRVYHTKSDVRLKVIAIARDGSSKERRVVVYVNKDTFRKMQPGEVWTSGISAFLNIIGLAGGGYGK